MVVAVDVDSASLSVLVPEHAASDAKANALSPIRTAVEDGRIDVERVVVRAQTFLVGKGAMKRGDSSQSTSDAVDVPYVE